MFDLCLQCQHLFILVWLVYLRLLTYFVDVDALLVQARPSTSGGIPTYLRRIAIDEHSIDNALIMGHFSLARDERFVALGLSLAAVGCITAMHIILQHFRDEAEIKPAQPKTQYITQDTEDSLKLSTLESLLQHYNWSIRDTCLRIVAGRAVHDSSVIDQLLWGITREDYEERMRNLNALIFVIENRDSYQDSLIEVLHTHKGYTAIVRSLELGLNDAMPETLNDPLYDEYLLRDIGERRCLMLLSVLVHRYGVERLVQAKFVEKWLAKQPWGHSDEERRKNFALYTDRKKNRISDICLHLKTSKEGRKALVKAKLATKAKRAKRDKDGSSDIKVMLEISMSNEGGEDCTDPDTPPAELVPRVNDQSVEEQRLRRRHREAMVLNDGTHSLGRGDIIERDHDSSGFNLPSSNRAAT
ncbi:hypothetical protein F5Y17DRAFT_425259 [Xylariaceae sp. FL0594]|nr:hypothetical protein F5Y17DRAFT_425259 [Xylariaceae sp. FL0594]